MTLSYEVLIRHDVDDDLHLVAVGFFDEVMKIVLGSVGGVDGVVVAERRGGCHPFPSSRLVLRD
jgi:hypothetical protein